MWNTFKSLLKQLKLRAVLLHMPLLFYAVFPMTLITAIGVWVLFANNEIARSAAMRATGSFSESISFMPITPVIAALFGFAAVSYLVIDFQQHARLFRLSFPEFKYRQWQHIRKVVVPRMRYNWIHGACSVAYGSVGFLGLSLFLTFAFVRGGAVDVTVDGSGTKLVSYESRPNFTGTAPKLSQIEVSVDDGPHEAVAVDGAGVWSYKPTQELAMGDHQLSIKATQSGNFRYFLYGDLYGENTGKPALQVYNQDAGQFIGRIPLTGSRLPFNNTKILLAESASKLYVITESGMTQSETYIDVVDTNVGKVVETIATERRIESLQIHEGSQLLALTATQYDGDTHTYQSFYSLSTNSMVAEHVYENRGFISGNFVANGGYVLHLSGQSSIGSPTAHTYIFGSSAQQLHSINLTDEGYATEWPYRFGAVSLEQAADYSVVLAGDSLLKIDTRSGLIDKVVSSLPENLSHTNIVVSTDLSRAWGVTHINSGGTDEFVSIDINAQSVGAVVPLGRVEYSRLSNSVLIDLAQTRAFVAIDAGIVVIDLATNAIVQTHAVNLAQTYGSFSLTSSGKANMVLVRANRSEESYMDRLYRLDLVNNTLTQADDSIGSEVALAAGDRLYYTKSNSTGSDLYQIMVASGGSTQVSSPVRTGLNNSFGAGYFRSVAPAAVGPQTITTTRNIDFFVATVTIDTHTDGAQILPGSLATFGGMAPSGYKVVLAIDGEEAGVVVAGVDDRWSMDVDTLTSGSRKISVRLYSETASLPIVHTDIGALTTGGGAIGSSVGLQQINLSNNQVETYTDITFNNRLPVSFSPDGRYVYTTDTPNFADPMSANITIYKHDIIKGEDISQLVLPGSYSVFNTLYFGGILYNSDASKMYIMDLIGDVLLVINTSTLQLQEEVQLANFNAEARDMLGVVLAGIKQSPDKSKIYIMSWDEQSVQVYDTLSGGLTNTPLGMPVYQITASPDNQRLYVATYDEVKVFDINSMNEVGSIPVLSGYASTVKFPESSSNAYIASYRSWSSRETQFTVFNPDTNAVVSTATVSSLNLNDNTWYAAPIEFSDDGSMAYMVTKDSNILYHYDVVQEQIVGTTALPDIPNNGLFAAGDDKLAITIKNGKLVLFNMGSQEVDIIELGAGGMMLGAGMLQSPTPHMFTYQTAGSSGVSVDVTVTDSSGVEFDFVTESLPDITLGTFGSDEVYRQSIQVSGPADSSWYCGLEHAITGGNLPANFRYRVEGDCFSRTAYLVGAVDTLSAGQYNVILQTTDPASGYSATKEYQITVHAAMSPTQFTGSTARVVDITSVIQETGGRLRIKGVGPAGKRVDIYNDNTLVGSANVAASGMWESVVSGVMPGQQNLSARWSTEGAVSFLPVSNILEQDSSQVIFSQIAIIDLQDGATIKEVPLPSGHLGVSVSARQNNKAYILTINANPASGQGTDTASVLEYSLDSGRLIKVFDVKASGSIAQMQIGPAGDSLYILTSTGVSEYSFGGELLRSASVSMDAGGTMGSFMAVYREMGISNDGNRVIVPTWWSYGDFPITTHIFDLDSSEYTSRADTSVPGGSKEQFTSSFTIGDKIYMVYSRGYVQIIDQRTAEVLDTFNFDLECDNGTGYCENLLSASYNPQSNVITASITIMNGSENREYSYEIREMDIETGDFDIISAPAGSWRILAHSQDYEKMYLFPSSLKMNGSAGNFPDNIYVFNTNLRTFSMMGPVLSGIPMPYSTSSQMSVFGASFSDSVSVAVESWGGEAVNPVNPTPVLPSVVPGENSEGEPGGRTLVISRPGVDTFPEAALAPVPVSGLPDVVKNMYENFQKRTTTTDKSTGFIAGITRLLSVKPITVVRVFPWVMLLSLVVLLLIVLIQLLRRLYFARKMKQMVQHQELLSHEKRSFLSLASHYLRTPLTILGAGIDQLPEESEARQKISTAANNLADVVKRLVGSIADDEALGTLVKPVAAQYQRASLFRPRVLVPAFLSIGLIIAINIVAVYGTHLSPGASHIAAQVVVWCALVGGLYILYDARDQQQEIGRYHQQLLTHEESLDSARNTLIRSVSEELTPAVMAVDAAVPPGLPEDSTKYIKEGLRQLESTLQHFLLISQLERQVLKQRARSVNLKSSIQYAQKVSAHPDAMLRSHIDAAALVEQPESLIRRVFSSLIDNAAEHSPPHQPVEVVSQTNKNSIQMEFRDHGEGISAEKMNLLFKPLSRIESAEDFTRQGMGLSLYDNRLIMHYLGGEITAESRVGKGTTMRLKIPKQFSA
jgi:signal transduction histidine kinase/molybdopterin-binding protein